MGMSNGFHPKFMGRFEAEIENGGVEMNVEVSIQVIQLQPAGLELPNLCVDFVAHRRSKAGLEKVAEACSKGGIRKMEVIVHQTGNLGGLECRPTAHKHQMKSNPERWMLSREFDSFVGM